MRKLLIVLPLAFVFGCPEARETAIREMSEQVFMKVLDKAKLDTATMAASGKAVNPEYRYEWFGGVGPYSTGTVRVIGVELGASVSGAGAGEAVVDQDLRDKLFAISQRADIGKEARRQLIAEVFAEAAKKWSDSATSQPSQ
jgi:hypothetical protein